MIKNIYLEILHTPKLKDNYQELINETLQEENTVLLENMEYANEENMVVGSKKTK